MWQVCSWRALCQLQRRAGASKGFDGSCVQAFEIYGAVLGVGGCCDDAEQSDQNPCGGHDQEQAAEGLPVEVDVSAVVGWHAGEFACELVEDGGEYPEAQADDGGHQSLPLTVCTRMIIEVTKAATGRRNAAIEKIAIALMVCPFVGCWLLG